MRVVRFGMKNIGAIGRLIWPSRPVASGCLFMLAGGFVVQLAQAQEINQQLWGVTPYAAISATAVSGNTLYVGGNFVSAAPVVGGGAITDGTTGELRSGSPRIAGIVYVCLADGKGGWYVGGDFRGAGSAARSNLAHVFASGRIDAWAPNPDGPVRALLILGQTLYVGGEFNIISNTLRPGVAALKLETAEATSWNPNVYGSVLSIAVHDTTVYLGGQFISVGGELRYNLASVSLLTGHLTSWDPEPDPTGYVRVLALRKDTLFVAGDFVTFAGTMVRSKLAAFDTRTGLLAAWDAHVGRVPANFRVDGGHRIFSMVLSGDKVYIAGSFNRVGDAIRPALAELDASTGEATAWDPGVGLVVPTSIPIVNAIALNGSSLYVAGTLDSLGSEHVAWCGALDVHTALRLPWDAAPNLSILAMAPSGNATYVGGIFTSIGPTVPRHGLAAFDLITGRVLPWDPNPNGQPLALAIHEGRVYVGGEFTRVGGEVRTGIAGLDMVSGHATAWAPQANGPVWAIAFSSSTAYLGGLYDHMGASARSCLSEVDLGNGLPTEWDPSPNDGVRSIVHDSGTVYVGGWFASIGGASRPFLAALDPSSGLASSWNPQADGIVDCLAIQDTTVFAGGFIAHLGGELRSGVGAVSSRTGLATSFRADMDGNARQLVEHHGVLYIGGTFTRVGGLSRNCLAAAKAENGTMLDWVPDPDGTVWALAGDDHQIYAGGAFARMGSTAVSLMAAISLAPLVAEPPVPVTRTAILAFDVTNPCRSRGIIHFSLRRAAAVTLGVFDMMGRRIQTVLAGGFETAGEHELDLSTAGLSPGVYLYRLQDGFGEVTRKTVLLR